MANNKKKNSRKLSFVLGGLSALTPSISATAEKPRFELSAIERGQLEEYTRVSDKAITGSTEYQRFAKKNKIDIGAIEDINNVESQCDEAITGIQSLMVDIADIRKLVKDFSTSVESAFASGVWKDPHPAWQIWKSWNADDYIAAQRDAWTNSIKNLTSLESKLENLIPSLKTNSEKFIYFYEDKKTMSWALGQQMRLLESVLAKVKEGKVAQSNIDIPDGGGKAEALGWRKAMKSLKAFKSQAESGILSCLNSVENYLSAPQKRMESLPGNLQALKEKVEGSLKENLTEAFYKKLETEKRDAAEKKARFEEQKRLEKEKMEQEKIAREKARQEEKERLEQEKAEKERLEREAKEQAAKEEQERLAKLRSDFEGTRKKLISSLSDKIEKRKIYWNNVTNPADEANRDIVEILKSKFNVEHEKLDAAGRAKLGEMEALSEFSEDNLKALEDLNSYPTQFGQQVADLNSAVSTAQEGLIKTKGDLLQFKADTLEDIAGKKSDFSGYVEKLGLALRQETQPEFKKIISPTEKSIMSGFDDLSAKLGAIKILLTDKKLNDKITSIKQSIDGLLKKVELSKENVLNQALKLKKDEIIKSLKAKQASVTANWNTINKFKPSDMPDKLKPFATKCLQKASERTTVVSHGLKDAMSKVDAYSLTDIDDDALDRINIEQEKALSDHSALIAKLCEVLVNQLEIFRADRARMRLWDKIYGNLPITEAPNDVKRLMDEEKLSKEEAIIRSCVDSLPGTDEYARTIVEGLFKPIERRQPDLVGIYSYGPSGIGKSEAVRYIGECSGCQLVTVTKDTFVKSGESAAKKIVAEQTIGRPTMILVDEADTIVPKSNGGNRTDSCGGFLTFFDTLQKATKKDNIVIVCTSNVPPSAIEAAATTRLPNKVQLGDPRYLSQGISKLLEPVKLNQSMSREQAIADIVGAVNSANVKASSPDRQIGFRAIKMAILNVCRNALKKQKADENLVAKPFEEDEFVPHYDVTEADVAVDPEDIISEISKLV